MVKVPLLAKALEAKHKIATAVRPHHFWVELITFSPKNAGGM
jgi:hypothetical protein